jgi:hypothetical protein
MPSSRPPADDSGPAKRRRPSKASGPAKSKGASKSGSDSSPPDASPPEEATPSGEPKAAAKKRRPRGPEVVVGLVGVGLDGTDGHTRLTKGDDFVLFGGSAETHEKMQDLTIRLTERLKKKGKRIAGADMREIRDIVEDLKNKNG